MRLKAALMATFLSIIPLAGLVVSCIWGNVPIAVISAIVLLLIEFFIIYVFAGRSEKLVQSIMDVLEDFTEGHFDSRITNVAVSSKELAARYNATLARVQDRVFRQQRRNRVVGQMLNQMNNGLITADTDLRVSYITLNAGSLFGIDVTEAEGRPLSDYFDEALEKAFSDAMANGNGHILTTELEGKTPEGAIRPLRVYTSALFREGKCTGAMAIIEDITEIRKLEQLRTDFAANVSHEMKTPLTSIKGFVETLQAGAIDNPQMARKFLNIIMMEAERLTRLINDILSITKLESGNENVELKPLDLDRAVQETVNMLVPQAELKQVTVSFSPNDEHSYVLGNQDRVKQILVNLIENAIKYNKVGGSVRIRLMRSKDTINLIVSDTGIGIKEENLARLFERFYRVDKGRSREMGGTGLGLAIVKHIVQTMNGYIEVHSAYGEGTDMLVTLPAYTEPNESFDNKQN